MEIRENEKVCIFAPLSGKLDRDETARLVREIMVEPRQIGIDLKYVYDCTIDFIEGLKQSAKVKKLAIFNIPSDIFVIFNVMKLDRVIDLYVSESDFEYQARRLVSRSFSLV